MNTLNSTHNTGTKTSSRIESVKLVFNGIFPALIVISISVMTSNLIAASGSDSTKHWVGTWACAPYPMGSNNSNFPPTIANNTARQVVRVSIGGDTVRVKFSNKTSNSATTMKAVNIAVSPDGTKSPVTESTITSLTFNGNASVTMQAKETVTSDPVAFDLQPSARTAITIYYGSAGNSSDMTGHVASRTDSYVASGDQSTKATFTGPVQTTAHWFHISAMEVLADTFTYAVACLGNSITDGYPLSGGLQNRWPDMFSEKLLRDPATAKVGVLNLGIGATNITGSGETTGMSRYKLDVLGQSGVRWFIILYGVNDIAAGTSANAITNTYKTMITDGHANNMKVYGVTLTPFMTYNDTKYTTRESVRTDVNKWIRTPGNFDEIIDFEKVIQDPSKPTELWLKYSTDGLHPNADGYKLLGESIDSTLFMIPTATRRDERKNSSALSETINLLTVNGKASVTFAIPHDAFVSLKVYSLSGKEIAELAGKNFSAGKYTLAIKIQYLTRGTYIYSMKTGELSVSGKMVLSR